MRPARTRRRRWIFGGLVVLLLAGVGIGWWLLGADDAEEAAAATTTVVTASIGDATRTVAGSGTLAAAQSEDLAFEVSGTVTDVLVELGEDVKEGAVLARVDRTLLKAEWVAAVSARDAAADELNDAETSGTSAQLAAATSQLSVAEDAVVDARQAWHDGLLKAPFAGQVISLDLAVGDRVGGSSGSGSAGGSTGVTSTMTTSGAIGLASTSTYAVDLTVGSTDLDSVKTGLQAEVTVTGVSDTLYGTVTKVARVASVTSSGSAAFPVTVTLTGDPGDDVFAGSNATVSIIVEKRTDVLTISSRALRSDGEATYVDLVGSDGRTTRREVEVGETYGMTTEILSGLSEGDEVQMTMAGGGRQGGMGGGFPGGPQ